MKLGLVGYTHKTSGIGIFIWELWQYLQADSILSVNSPVKGQEEWLARQQTAGLPPTDAQVEEYLERFTPDVIMVMETPFTKELWKIAKRHGVKTVAIPMHESYLPSRLKPADLLICTCPTAWEKVKVKSPNQRAVALHLPIGLELFPYRERTGHTLVLNIGYGGVQDRRQSQIVFQAFRKLPRSARLIVNSQVNMERVSDSRITFNIGGRPEPREMYEEGDIAIQLSAYGGYERQILESMSSGMPTITVDADPMNMHQHDSDFLVPPASSRILNSKWVCDTAYNKVSVEAVVEKLKWLLTIDTAEYSRRARAQAEAQSWESKQIPYRDIWLETLNDLYR